MKKYLIYPIVFIFVSFVFAGNNVFSAYNAMPESNRVLVTWQTSNENNIRYFIVKRSNDNKLTYNHITQVTKQGPGYDYQYYDDNVFFKSADKIYYRIDAINEKGDIVESTGDMPVRPNISGIFKTWGALKAIFR